MYYRTERTIYSTIYFAHTNCDEAQQSTSLIPPERLSACVVPIVHSDALRLPSSLSCTGEAKSWSLWRRPTVNPRSWVAIASVGELPASVPVMHLEGPHLPMLLSCFAFVVGWRRRFRCTFRRQRYIQADKSRRATCASISMKIQINCNVRGGWNLIFFFFLLSIHRSVWDL